MVDRRVTLPTSDEVVAALRDAGWLLEQDTARALSAGGFHVKQGKAFPDPDDGTVSREIDVYGYRQLYRDDKLSFSVGIQVLAECKQSSMPYVVVGGPASRYELERDRKEQLFRFPTVETGRTDLGDGRAQLHYTSAREYLGIDKLPGNPWEGGFLGTQLTRLDRKRTWLADNRGIFTSLVYPLAKALTHFRSQANRTAHVIHRAGQEWASIDFFYPVVVTSAPVFAVDVMSENLEAVEVPWAAVTREIKSAKVDGQFNIDVVSARSLSTYLADRVNKFGNAVGEIARNDPGRFVRHQDHEYAPRLNS